MKLLFYIIFLFTILIHFVNKSTHHKNTKIIKNHAEHGNFWASITFSKKLSIFHERIVDDIVTMWTLISKFSHTLGLSKTKFLCNGSDSSFTFPISVQLETCSTHWTLPYLILFFLRIIIKNSWRVLRTIDSCYAMGMSWEYLSFHSFNFIAWLLRFFIFIARCKGICCSKFYFIGFIIKFCIFLTSQNWWSFFFHLT